MIVIGNSGFIGQHLVNYLGFGSINFDINNKDGITHFCDVRKHIDFESKDSCWFERLSYMDS